jgi:predicted DNA-binding transcriptional regulator YafY
MVRVICNKRAFYYWIMQYNNQFEVVSPKEVIDEIIDTAKNMLETYKDK